MTGMTGLCKQLGAGVALLAACASALACKPQVRVQLFGDSTQEGYDGSNNLIAKITPAAALQGALDREFGRGKVAVAVRAVQGTTSLQLIAGTDGRNAPWPRSVDADIIVINHGINDMTHYAPGRLARFSGFGWVARMNGVKRYTASLRTLAAAPARVIFETPNIVKGGDVAPYAAAMRSVAIEVRAPVADVYAYTSRLLDWKVLIPDWAHPSSALYERIGTLVLAPVVAAEVRLLLCK